MSKVTQEEVLNYDNVPSKVAAEYLGVSIPYIHARLRSGRAVYGDAVLNPGGKWSYHISPGMLVAYKTGTLALNIVNHIVAGDVT